MISGIVRKVLFSVILLIVAVIFQDKLQYYYSTYVKSGHNNQRVFTAESLVDYDGVNKNKLYVAVLGAVYDVSPAPQHYAKGSPYHYFVGKDGSRALVNGDFQNESDDKDHVLDFSCKDFLFVLQWRDSFKKKYKKVGILAGRYYDSYGNKTPYLTELYNKIEICIDEKEQERKQDVQFPPCNIAWSEDEGTKVWCTKTSGGMHRSWVGVPRQLYTPGEKWPKCVCVNTDSAQEATMKFKEYENCDNTSVVCFVNSS